MTIKQVKIWDMDGVLVDSSHRYSTVIREDGKEVINLPFWRERETEFYIMRDGLLPHAQEYQDDLKNPEIYTVIATARQLAADSPDWRFIRERLGMPHHIIHRKPGDSRSGALLKVLGLRKLFALRQFRQVLESGAVQFCEDNRDYLRAVCEAFPTIRGVYVPSVQGH